MKHPLTILVSALLASDACGYPAPKRPEPTTAELIVGVWDVEGYSNGRPPAGMAYEFTPVGTVIVSRPDTAVQIRRYRFDDKGELHISKDESESRRFRVESVAAETLNLVAEQGFRMRLKRR